MQQILNEVKQSSSSSLSSAWLIKVTACIFLYYWKTGSSRTHPARLMEISLLLIFFKNEILDFFFNTYNNWSLVEFQYGPSATVHLTL